MSVHRVDSIGRRLSRAFAAAAVALGAISSPALAQQKVFRVPNSTDGPKTLDPASGSTLYENRVISAVYETLLQYKYLARPLEVEPLLAADMPQISDDGRVWRFTLRDDVFYIDDPCFPGGKGRKMVSGDVCYGWKRLADPKYEYKEWWLLEGMIVGLDEYKELQKWKAFVSANAEELANLGSEAFMTKCVELRTPIRMPEIQVEQGEQVRLAFEQWAAQETERIWSELNPTIRERLIAEFAGKPAEALRAGAEFDYDAPVEGLRIIDDRTFEVELVNPSPQFCWKLAMFQLSPMAREAVEHYGDAINKHPVGTGPFMLARDQDWTPGKKILLTRNPKYREAHYPSEWEPEDEQFGFHEAAGKRIPFLDAVEITYFVEPQPMWLDFKARQSDFTTMPDFSFEEAMNKRSKKLKADWAAEGIILHKVPLLDFIFRGFNMEDPVIGGYSAEKRALRQAICLAMDWDETNEVSYWGTVLVYDGMIPPGLDGHPEGGRAPVSYRGPDLDRAREKLREAGFEIGADGRARGVPLIDFYTSNGADSRRNIEVMQRHLEPLGIPINPKYVDFTTLMEAVDTRKAPWFSFAWGSDYPDGENNLALFYSKNKSPGSNHFNYDNPEFDRLYEQARTMNPGPERTAIYETLRDMVIEDAVFCGSLARTRHYLVRPWVKYFKPTEDFENYFKYIDLDVSDTRRPAK